MNLDPHLLRSKATILRNLARSLDTSARLCEVVNADPILVKMLNGPLPAPQPAETKAVAVRSGRPAHGSMTTIVTDILEKEGAPLRLIEIRRRMSHGSYKPKEDTIGKIVMYSGLFKRFSRGVWGLATWKGGEMPKNKATHKFRR